MRALIFGRSALSSSRRLVWVVAVLFGTGLVAGAGIANATATPEAAARPVITIKDFAFGGMLIVSPGATVSVRNDDPVMHTLTAADGSFTTKTIQPGKTATFKAPKKVGSVAITCKFHPDMAGFLTVAKPGHPIVTIVSFSYQGVLTVRPGATVTVRNDDDVMHTLTAADGSFTTKTIQPGKTATFKAPKKVGSFAITCKFHPDMTGTLTVAR